MKMETILKILKDFGELGGSISMVFTIRELLKTQSTETLQKFIDKCYTEAKTLGYSGEQLTDDCSLDKASYASALHVAWFTIAMTAGFWSFAWAKVRNEEVAQEELDKAVAITKRVTSEALHIQKQWLENL